MARRWARSRASRRRNDRAARRARADLDRLTAVPGAAGEWTAVAAAPDRPETAVLAGGDPKPALVALEQLVRAHPGYPRAIGAMLVIARGWERDGDAARAL